MRVKARIARGPPTLPTSHNNHFEVVPQGLFLPSFLILPNFYPFKLHLLLVDYLFVFWLVDSQNDLQKLERSSLSFIQCQTTKRRYFNFDKVFLFFFSKTNLFQVFPFFPLEMSFNVLSLLWALMKRKEKLVSLSS